MAKKPSEMTADERREQETLEANVQRDEARERTLDERVAAAIPANEPVEAPEPLCVICDKAESEHNEKTGHVFRVEPFSAAETFLKDAQECQAVYASGNAVSPDTLKNLVNRAVGIITTHEAEKKPAA